MQFWTRALGAAPVVVWLATACSAASSNGNTAGFDDADAGTAGGGFGEDASTSGDSGTTSAADSGGPPETKVEGQYQTPVSTGQYVWIANPTSGRVAYIQASTLAVSTIAAGDGPTYLAAIPGTGDSAIVQNVLSHDATLLHASNGTITTTTFPLAVDVNAWVVSSDGHWALAWGDVTQVTNPDPTQGFQDVSVLDLTGKVPATIVSIGFRPSEVAFANDSRHAYAVTQDGVSVIDLTGATPQVTANWSLDIPGMPAPAPEAGVGDAASEDGAAIEDAGGSATGTTPVTSPPDDVAITPDGHFALERRNGQPTIGVVDLTSGNLAVVDLPANATDLTLTPTGDAALVVMRDISTVATLPIPAIASNPASFTTLDITGQTVGRALVGDDGHTTLLFTTALPVDAITILDLTAQTFRTTPLHLPLLAVFPAPKSQDAIVLHTVPAGSDTSAMGAFSVVPVGLNLPAKLVGTNAAPNAVGLSPAGDRAIVTTSDTNRGVYEAYVVKMPTLEVDPYVLASPPIGTGVVAGANVAYVAQSNDEGRITFIDLSTGVARTITGFELGSRTVVGSQP
jgi:hypothetical protein